MKYVLKRDSKLEPFDQERITIAIWKAAKAVGGKDKEQAKRISDEVVALLNKQYGDDGVPTVEEIQDLVEKRLIENGHASTAKAYILYRKQHTDMRELAALLSSSDMVDQYLEVEDWRVKENSNMSYSLQGLNNYLSSTVIAKYWIARIYPQQIAEAHFSGDMHIHDLGVLGPYCVGWDVSDLLLSGFGGVSGKIESKPAKHFRTALGQVVNFFYTLQGEAAGAQAFSNFDTYLAPFIRYDHLTQKDVEQALQEFFFNMNVPTRVGFQTPFTNLTLDLTVPDFMKNEAVLYNGKVTQDTYGDMTKEMEMFNLAFAEGMRQGDSKGRVFTFPIPTYNITKDFDWESPVSQAIFEVTAKYGVPYFSNFVNSDMKPEDVRSMCCRLRIDNRELRKRGGGFFGANPLTGSGVVTLNIPRIGYLSKNEDEFFERLEALMETAKSSLEIKRKVLEAFTDNGLYPYSRRYLRHVKEGYDKYWKNHFSTIGIVGVNEAIINLLGQNIASRDGQAFAQKMLTFMRDRLADYQEETSCIYNLEATPAEGTSYRLARIDKKRYRDIIFANQKQINANHAEPFYTNSSQLPVDFSGDLFDALEHQETLQSLYTGGTVFHIFLGERLQSWKSAAELIKKVAWNSKLPYFTLTPTFSICPTHGYTNGEHKLCPVCGAPSEVYSRVVGYLRPVDQWNDGKQAEFDIRKTFDRSNVISSAPLTV
jgi:anaerobic ribonucleoside-triphosphate reductase